jgi:hypothetical protein
MPSKNSIIDRFTMFGVRVVIKCDDDSLMDAVRSLLSVFDLPQFLNGRASVYIVLRSYDVNNGISK